jgi:hypothetical protein
MVNVTTIFGLQAQSWRYSSDESENSIIPILLIFGGTVFCLLGALHAIYTLLDERNPQRLAPVDPAVADAMAHSALRLSRGGTDMWRAWIGFNFSHSLGLLLVGVLGIWAGSRIKTFPGGIMPALTLIGCVYVFLALRHWFRTPALGVAIGTSCFAAAWILSLRSAPLIGTVAIGTVSSVLYASWLAGGCTMVHTVVSTEISAPPELLSELYADYAGWPRLFPATIRGVQLLADDGQRKTIEVDHATEGKVINIMTVVSPHEIRLEEFKRRFSAEFVNRFEAAGQGTRYSIVADVQLKGIARALAPLASPIVRARLNRFVLEPMRAAVESGLRTQQRATAITSSRQH